MGETFLHDPRNKIYIRWGLIFSFSHGIVFESNEEDTTMEMRFEEKSGELGTLWTGSHGYHFRAAWR